MARAKAARMRQHLLTQRRIAGARVEPRLTGVPVLFVPGSGGSYKQARALRYGDGSCASILTCSHTQVRSFASETARQHNALRSGRVLDWYAVDFKEELSAFDGSASRCP